MNGIKLFRVFGITVFLHWSWIVVAAIEIQMRRGDYDSITWNIAEYLLLFVIVLLHEFGHALACRSVGGSAERIMLWPLGGVAFVSPPPRPGALLWSIAAGPLVNVLLLAISWPLVQLHLQGDLGRLIYTVAWINAALLIFNLLPIYPLDGGQILQSLLWFGLGRGRSMGVATVIGIIGAAGLGLFAWHLQSYWLGIMAFFAASQCWAGWKQGVLLRARENAPRRTGFACPACHQPPLVGKFWKCGHCQTLFDTFETGATCPTCGSRFATTACGACKTVSPFAQWQTNTAAVPGTAALSAVVPLDPNPRTDVEF
jgi:Zn-dependent protease